jgi:2'-5' RNA ligase
MKRLQGQKRYSIWIVPPPGISDSLARLICTLGKAHGGPVFEPHVTLLGSIQSLESHVINTVSQIAESTAPFIIQLTKLEFLNQYFRCLFVKVEKSQELMNLHEQLKNLLGYAAKSDFMPHLSLLYGHIGETHKREIIAKISDYFPMHFQVSKIVIEDTSPDIPADCWQRYQDILLSG